MNLNVVDALPFADRHAYVKGCVFRFVCGIVMYQESFAAEMATELLSNFRERFSAFAVLSGHANRSYQKRL